MLPFLLSFLLLTISGHLTLISLFHFMKRLPPQQPTHRSKPDTLTLGNDVTKTSFGSNEQVWDTLVRLGLICAHPCCCDCQTPFNFQRARSCLHFSFKCWKCGTNNNLLKGTALENVKKIRLFFMVTIAWVSKGKTTTLLGQTGIDHRTLADIGGGFRVS